ncbi:MAG: DUF423 domain-containing protein [Chitinophagia bacterium]|nr:DUF423 domain-containing protein [Chitinophagia bacterium]
MYKPALISGICFALLSVVLGAFAAHGLTSLLTPSQIEVFQKGVTYQFYHAFALLFAGIIYYWFPDKNIAIATVSFIIGIWLFSGSLYAFPLMDAKQIVIPTALRLITPLGGLSFIVGWVFLLLAVIKSPAKI